MIDSADGVRWLVLSVRLAAEPSRHRVAVWRELRRTGAMTLGQGTWVVPDVAVFADGVARAVELVERGGGDVVVLNATGRSPDDGVRLATMFNAERDEEWAEFGADCAKFDAEIDKEIAKAKFTVPELEEEEQSLERLRRWFRAIRTRDVFATSGRADAELQLKHCEERLTEYAEKVFHALHQM